MEELYQIADIVRGRYRLTDILGQGGTATTYQAEDLVTKTTVAIKVLSLHQVIDWKIVELFAREAKVLARLHHPKIPKYLDYFYLDTKDNRTFF